MRCDANESNNVHRGGAHAALSEHAVEFDAELIRKFGAGTFWRRKDEARDDVDVLDDSVSE